MKFNYEKDALMTSKVKRQQNRNTFYEYDVIYPWTNEDLREFFHDFNLKDKKILTVTSSGDHFLNLVLNGALDITCFDINKLTKYYQELKIAYVKMHNFEGFKKGLSNELTYWSLITYFKNNKDAFKLLLSKEVFHFWNLSLSKCNPEDLVSFDITNLMYHKNEYFNKEKYNLLKENLKYAKPKYIDANIKNLPKLLNEKYDYIFTSNLFYYYIKTGSYLKVFNSLNDILNENGQIIQYSFRPHHENDLYFDNRIKYDKKIVYKFEDLDEQYYESVISYRKNKK